MIWLLDKWRHTGFNVYAGPRILPRFEKSMENLARYTCPPMFVESEKNQGSYAVVSIFPLIGQMPATYVGRRLDVFQRWTSANDFINLPRFFLLSFGSSKENETGMFSYIFMKILESRPHRYDWGIDFLTKGQAGKIKEHIVTNFVRSGMVILDVGCGTGDLAVRAARAGAFVTGVDISEGMLAVAQERAKENGLENKIVLHHAGVVEIDNLFDEKSFDLITSTLVMSELYTEDREWALKELLRILKPEGKLLVVSEVIPKHFLKRAIYYALRFPLALITYLISQTGTKPVRNIVDEMRQAGFEITEERYSFLESFVTIVARRSKVAQPAAVARVMKPDQDRSQIRSLFDFCGRWFPNPVVPGLRRIGTPDRNSPVIVTGNFHLTVRRVEKALTGQNCYLDQREHLNRKLRFRVPPIFERKYTLRKFSKDKPSLKCKNRVPGC